MAVQNFALANICPALAFNLDRLVGDKLDPKSWGRPVEELAPSLQEKGWVASEGPAPVGYLWDSLPEDVQIALGDPIAHLLDTMERYTDTDQIVVKRGDEVVWSCKAGEAITRARALHTQPLQVVTFSRNRTIFAAHFVPRDISVDIDIQEWVSWDAVHKAQDAENVQSGRRKISPAVKLSRVRWYFDRGYSESAIGRALGLNRGERQKMYALAEFDASFPELRVIERAAEGPKVEDGKLVYSKGGGIDLRSLDWQTMRSLTGSIKPGQESFTTTAADLLRKQEGVDPDGNPVITYRTATAFDGERYIAKTMGQDGGKERRKVAIPHSDLKQLATTAKGAETIAYVASVLQAILDGNRDWFAEIKAGKDSYAPVADAPVADAPVADAPVADASTADKAPRKRRGARK